MNIQFDKTKQVNLDLACGDNKKEGFLGIDKWKTESTDYVFDLLDKNTPWPIDDCSVDSINCSHFIEHIDGMDRPRFMEECYRILKLGAKMTVITPYWSSMRYQQDFSHKFPAICESSFLYFNTKWREDNKLTHGVYDIKCNFEYTYGYILDQEVSIRNQEYQYAAIKHYNNAVSDLIVTLTKI